MSEIKIHLHKNKIKIIPVYNLPSCFMRKTGVDWRIILKWMLEKWDGNMDWINLAQDRDRWRAVVNAIMNLRFP